MPGIYLTTATGLTALAETQYANEALLQELIAQHPELLAVDDDAGPLLLVRREAAVYDDQDVNAHGSLDHLFLDAEGVPVLVEVKRSTDARIRREVVGQLLDYAAGATNWKVERLQGWLDERCGAQGLDAASVIADHTDDPEGFWQQVSDNLAARRMRLYVVADTIPGTLRAIVEFLNEQLSACEVLAVEIKQYLDADQRQTIVVPTVVGATEKAKEAKGPRKIRHWSLETVLADLAERLPPAEVEVARTLVAWARERGDLVPVFGHGAIDGSVQYGIADGERRIFPFVLYSNGAVEIPFTRMAGYRPFSDRALREQYRLRLNALGLTTVLAPEAVDRRPSFPLSDLAGLDDPATFSSVLEWVYAQPGTLP